MASVPKIGDLSKMCDSLKREIARILSSSEHIGVDLMRAINTTCCGGFSLVKLYWYSKILNIHAEMDMKYIYVVWAHFVHVYWCRSVKEPIHL